MAQKGVLTEAEPLQYDDYKRLVNGLREEEKYIWELYCRLAFGTAFRISDIKNLKWKEILGKTQVTKIEKKTNKNRQVKFNSKSIKVIKELYELLGKPDLDSYAIANPRTKRPYSTQHINYVLKFFKVDYNLPINNFSTHSLRKTFGRYFYETKGKSPHALMLLCRQFNHDSPETTLAYIGITNDEINSVFDEIEI